MEWIVVKYAVTVVQTKTVTWTVPRGANLHMKDQSVTWAVKWIKRLCATRKKDAQKTLILNISLANQFPSLYDL